MRPVRDYGGYLGLVSLLGSGQASLVKIMVPFWAL